jgi:hypothetical protein
MNGVIVFITVFIASFGVTLANHDIQPGKHFYSLLRVPETAYPVLGIPTTTLVIASLQRCCLWNNSMFDIHTQKKLEK